MQKIEMALSPHARPQAVDEASYSLRPEFWKGPEAIHMVRRARPNVRFGRQTGIGVTSPNVIK